MKLNKIVFMSAAMAGSLWGLTASAQIFTYNPGDLFVAFRTTTGPNDLVVDIGSSSTYQGGGGPFTISGVNASTLTSTFGGLDGIYWSVFGYASDNALFTSSPRGDINTQTDPTPSAPVSGQEAVISKMGAILGAAVNNGTALSSSQVLINSSLNLGSRLSYSIGVASLAGANQPGNFRNTWISVENFTGTGFAASGAPDVSDLYQNEPGNPLTTSGTYLGNFSLGNDGSLTFNPVPEPNTFALMGAGMFALTFMRRIGRRN